MRQIDRAAHDTAWVAFSNLGSAIGNGTLAWLAPTAAKLRG
ncbi:hypothetical protein [Chamaesiphon sp. OTE_75_metabat_556]|nr:hypothetical protein [Chamaesiphon sp. OTE_75_metabat_556]